ncbi:MAG: hypothetical protein EAZ85_11235 [Bacteroidetes bacterium]|nr:MAG: hypothetical protein EAZ85_11235 [Bacteroidota bacterium]TAG90496.1 MAG: hypothetical protein EAZ20_04270 [Bacteroidota bacterium]
MNKIEYNGKLRAIVHRAEEWKEGIDFLTPDETFIQVVSCHYHKDKHIRAHWHIENERLSLLTQETVYIVNGSMRVDLYGDDKEVFHQEILKQGDTIIIIEGGHGYHILEDHTKVLEIKNGPFVSVEKDKAFIYAKEIGK